MKSPEKKRARIEAGAEALKPDVSPEKPTGAFETREAASEYADRLEARVETEAAAAAVEGERLLAEAVRRAGGEEADIVEGKRSMAGIQAEIDAAAAQAHEAIQDTIVEEGGAAWAEQGQRAMTERGYVPDAAVAAYKSFGVGERFLIQKARAGDGREVVVKMSAPNEKDGRQLRREGGLLELVNGAAEQVAASGGEKAGVSFPRRLDAFRTAGQEALVTDFIVDDREAKRAMSPEEQADVLLGALQEMQKLPVPSEELSRPRAERLLEARRGGDFVGRWDRFLPGLVEDGLLDQGEAAALSAAIRGSVEDIDGLPLRFDHGDLHFGNLAVARDEATGGKRTTLMDLEALKAANEFVGVAQILNRTSFAAALDRYPELATTMPKLAAALEENFGVFKAENLAERVEREFVDTQQDSDKAARVLRLMLVDEALEGLHFSKDKEGPYRIKHEIYRDILQQRLADLLESGR